MMLVLPREPFQQSRDEGFVDLVRVIETKEQILRLVSQMGIWIDGATHASTK